MFGLGLGLGIHRHSNANPYAFPFISRVEADGGIIRDKTALLNLTYYLQSMMPNTKLLYCPELGVKLRTSGINNYVTKLYSIYSGAEVLGPELITNGNFDTDSVWVKGTDWAIENGTAKCNGVNFGNFIRQNGVLTIGKTYKVSVKVSLVSGIIGYYPGNAGTKRALSNGDNSFYVLHNGSTGDAVFGSENFIGSIDNVSVKEVLNMPDNDAVQTTALNQPYLSGNIAPNEKYAIKNPNNLSTYLTNTDITFESTDNWSMTTVLNDYYSDLTRSYYTGGGIGPFVSLRATATDYRLTVYLGTTYVFSINTIHLHGKNTVVTLTYNDSKLSVFVNGNFIGSKDVVSNAIFRSLFYSSLSLKGTISYHAVRSIALTPEQISMEYNYLRNMFPEIENVKIGDQYWATSNCEMTCTPMGNVIPEMQAAINVEKITNVADREFSSDTGFWSKASGWAISNGFAEFVHPGSVPGTISRLGLLTTGKRFKIRLKVDDIKGVAVFNLADFSSHALSERQIKIGTNDYYLVSTTGNLSIVMPSNISTDYIKIDSISVEEVGWADSTNLYNYIYSVTTGTSVEKEYAAVKAAAMWCYYNNDPTLGAVYGKLYNWYAVRLLQMDIDYYNTANPTSQWGWRIPTSTDFTELSVFLGGSSMAGKKLKKEGSIYWGALNTEATNESGFSALGGGIRFTDGTFVNIYSQYRGWGTAKNILVLDASTNGANITTAAEFTGRSLRLIKA